MQEVEIASKRFGEEGYWGRGGSSEKGEVPNANQTRRISDESNRGFENNHLLRSQYTEQTIRSYRLIRRGPARPDLESLATIGESDGPRYRNER